MSLHISDCHIDEMEHTTSHPYSYPNIQFCACCYLLLILLLVELLKLGRLLRV